MPRSRFLSAHGSLKLLEIRGHRRIGMMIREIRPSISKNSSLGIAIQALENAMHHWAAGAVAGVEHHLDASLEFELRRDFVDVWRNDIDRRMRAAVRSRKSRASMIRRTSWISSP